MRPPPIQSPFDANGKPVKAWLDWCNDIATNSKYRGSDTTANRPANGLTDGDWYLDTTLGKPVWYYGSGWIDATGTTV